METKQRVAHNLYVARVFIKCGNLLEF